jgi:hypothetical protein
MVAARGSKIQKDRHTQKTSTFSILISINNLYRFTHIKMAAGKGGYVRLNLDEEDGRPSSSASGSAPINPYLSQQQVNG